MVGFLPLKCDTDLRETQLSGYPVGIHIRRPWIFQTRSSRGRKHFKCGLQQRHSAKCLLFVCFISVCPPVALFKGNVCRKCAHCFVMSTIKCICEHQPARCSHPTQNRTTRCTTNPEGRGRCSHRQNNPGMGGRNPWRF